MKRISGYVSMIVLVLVLVLSLMASTVLAGGGQVCNTHQGDVGQGTIEQYQIRNN